MKIRIKFAKEGTMKFIGHLDMMRYFQKIMRRADVDICYSTGFSPHQIMSFAAPLGVGMESRGEYVDIEVKSTDSSEEMLRRINEVMVDGSEVLSYRALPDDASNAMSIVSAADYRLRFREGYEPEDWRDFMDGLLSFMKQEQILILKKTKKSEKEVDIRPMIYELHEEENHAIFLNVATGSSANLKPSAVIQAYMDSRNLPLSEFALMITRLEVYAPKKEDPSTLIPLEEFGEDIK
ncbi:TIGR03936 family radical SAM-associated protein [Brotaphodocola sp.]|uniref:TIGR03936 family radical SAM-associated protein n=1 Tax=Brotaphodocola sp. TaxID=3073577 RepID=UPI003D7E2962